MTAWAHLRRFLQTDPRDIGCERVLRLLHVYVERVLGVADIDSAVVASRRYPGVAAHLLACGPCAEDYEGMLATMKAERP